MTKLHSLKGVDQATANGVLAAVALCMAPNPGFEQAPLLSKYRTQAEEVSREIRDALRLGDGALPPADKARFDRFLAEEIQNSVFSDGGIDDALAQAGQSGRLPLSIYHVQLAPNFLPVFASHGIKKKLVEKAVHKPDDHIHLMTEEAKDADVISLFMIKILNGDENHWLLVQTFRRGIVQIAQSAWRVYPSDVDLSNAQTPLDVLKAFVAVYGMPVRVGEHRAKFVERLTIVGVAGRATDYLFGFGGSAVPTRHFASISHVVTVRPNELNVGVAYCIDLDKYERSLKRRKFNV